MTRFKWLNRWISASLINLHLAIGILFLALYAVGLLAPDARLEQAGYWGIFVLILVHLLHLNLHICYLYLKNQQELSHFPAAQMKWLNSILVSLFLAACAFVMALAPYLGIDRLLGRLGNLLVQVIRWLVSLRKPAQQTAEQAAKWERSNPFAGLEAAEPSALVRFLDALLYVIGIALLIVLAFWMLRAALQALLRLLKPRSYDDDEKIFLAPGDLKLGQKRARSKKEAGLWRDFSYNGRVRRRYKGEIKKYGGKLPACASPEELEKLAGWEEENGLLHQLYEKARYSEQGCSREDVGKLK